MSKDPLKERRQVITDFFNTEVEVYVEGSVVPSGDMLVHLKRIWDAMHALSGSTRTDIAPSDRLKGLNRIENSLSDYEMDLKKAIKNVQCARTITQNSIKTYNELLERQYGE